MTRVKIAIVDDQELVRDSTSNLLRSMGYATVTFASAEDFLESGERGIGCIVSDVQMPGCSGLDLASELAGVLNAPPIILMTAYPTDAIRVRSQALGVLALLEKPLDGGSLARVVTRALGC